MLITYMIDRCKSAPYLSEVYTIDHKEQVKRKSYFCESVVEKIKIARVSGFEYQSKSSLRYVTASTLEYTVNIFLFLC